MKKCAFIILLSVIACSAEILNLGKRPSWYPDDGPEIEAECLEEHDISSETLADIKNFHIENKPAIRAFLLCFFTETNVYRPEKGPEIKRIAVALRESLRLNKCDLDMIRDCIEEHGALELKDYAFFNIMKCVYEQAPARCLAKLDK